jgi:hypothetical protein
MTTPGVWTTATPFLITFRRGDFYDFSTFGNMNIGKVGTDSDGPAKRTPQPPCDGIRLLV